MIKELSIALLALTSIAVFAETKRVCSPDGKMQVSVIAENGTLKYQVEYGGKEMIAPSSLGLKTDMGDYTRNLTPVRWNESKIDETYTMTRTKASKVNYVANALAVELKAGGCPYPMTVVLHTNICWVDQTTT